MHPQPETQLAHKQGLQIETVFFILHVFLPGKLNHDNESSVLTFPQQ